MQGTKELREKLATACRLLYMEGLMDHAGLAGARIPETGNLLLNPREMRGTPGRHPGIMTASDFVVVDPDGAKMEGENNPPSETPIFTGVFRARADAMAIFHLHLPTATLFSIAG
ncbi:MAG: class II aldolase/adducin family protein, partial [Betaproteobacteria bacterium]